MSERPPVLDPLQRSAVEAAVRDCLQRASRELGRSIPVPPVRFDLSGRSAGMFRARGRHSELRFNPWIFARYYSENLRETVPHEVAHYLVWWQFPRRRMRSHGAEWQAWMGFFGVPAAVTFDRDISGLPQRRQRRFLYRCDCSEHSLSSTRHYRQERGQASYQCRRCGSPLRRGG